MTSPAQLRKLSPCSLKPPDAPDACNERQPTMSDLLVARANVGLPTCAATRLSLLVPRRAGQHPASKRLGSRLPHPCGRVPSVSTGGRITPGPACAR
jgi:hypothetical protein